MEEQKLPIEKELEQIMALGEPLEENMVGKCECLTEAAVRIFGAAVEQYKASVQEQLVAAKAAALQTGLENSADVRKVIDRIEGEMFLAGEVGETLHWFKICD